MRIGWESLIDLLVYWLMAIKDSEKTPEDIENNKKAIKFFGTAILLIIAFWVIVIKFII